MFSTDFINPNWHPCTYICIFTHLQIYVHLYTHAYIYMLHKTLCEYNKADRHITHMKTSFPKINKYWSKIWACNANAEFIDCGLEKDLWYIFGRVLQLYIYNYIMVWSPTQGASGGHGHLGRGQLDGLALTKWQGIGWLTYLYTGGATSGDEAVRVW